MAPLGPGPHCSQILADLGAEIIKVEQPEPSEGKRAGRILRLPPDSAIRRNARTIRLNLKTDGGREAFHKLAATCDVVLEGYRPGIVKRLGADYDTLKALRPDVIYASLSGYGQEGPYSAYVGHDINYQGVTGVLDMTGPSDGPPVIPGTTTADSAGGGMNAAISVLAALLARERSGGGQYIDMAMVDGLATMMFLTIDEYLTTGHVPRRGETLLTGQYPWYNIYETQDGKYVSVGAIEAWFYENLCRSLGREDFIEHQYAEGEKREEIFAAFREIFRSKPRDQWVSELMPAETCVGPVLAVDEVAHDKHLRQRGLIAESEAPDGSRRECVGVMVRTPAAPAAVPVRDGPADATPDVLRELGYDDGALDALRRDGAIA
jgi:crotonobetainyl-CoA:carnitine CoA-transferase CaiB-like acyl-CoA transferase